MFVPSSEGFAKGLAILIREQDQRALNHKALPVQLSVWHPVSDPQSIWQGSPYLVNEIRVSCLFEATHW